MSKRDQWKPTRRGPIYCSPICGANCTHAEYLRAKAAAEKMVKNLGAGWEIDVWDNLGWHWAANKGVARVSPNKHYERVRRVGYRLKVTGYTCYFNSERQVIGEGKTPLEAVVSAVFEALKLSRAIRRDVARLKIDIPE